MAFHYLGMGEESAFQLVFACMMLLSSSRGGMLNVSSRSCSVREVDKPSFLVIGNVTLTFRRASWKNV